MDEMIDKIKKEYSKPKDSDSDDITESAISSSMSAAKKQTQVEESYTTDDFEDISMSASMSASKTGISSQIKKNVKS